MMAALIGSAALMPNPALTPLERLVGEWRTTGTHPFLPGALLRGRASFAWHEGGAFLVMRTEIDDARFPAGVAIFGSDDDADTFFMLYFDDRGVSRKCDGTVERAAIAWRRDDPDFSQRNVLTLSPSGDRIVGRGEMSRGGGEWEDDLSLTYERMKD